MLARCRATGSHCEREEGTRRSAPLASRCARRGEQPCQSVSPKAEQRAPTNEAARLTRGTARGPHHALRLRETPRRRTPRARGGPGVRSAGPRQESPYLPPRSGPDVALAAGLYCAVWAEGIPRVRFPPPWCTLPPAFMRRRTKAAHVTPPHLARVGASPGGGGCPDQRRDCAFGYAAAAATISCPREPARSRTAAPQHCS